jgi:hypothetical protein
MRIDFNVDFNSDQRVKGCPNVNCEMHKNKKQQDYKNDLDKEQSPELLEK